MKIVCVSHGSSLRGGAELCFLEMLKGLASSGHSVHAVVPEQGELTQELANEGISVSVVGFTWWVSINKSWRKRLRRIRAHFPTCIKLIRTFRQIHPDLVLTNTLAIGASAVAAKWCRIPHVWYVHEFGAEDHGFHFDIGARLTHFTMDKLSRRIVVNSIAVSKQFGRRMSFNKIRVIPYAVEVPKQGPDVSTPQSVFRLILVGRMVPSKGQQDAIRAVASLVKKGLPIRLVLLGAANPEYLLALRKLVESFELEDHVQFAGFNSNSSSYVQSSDVALMCSRSEAFGRVTVEAMKLGKPVIGANSGGTAELIQDGFNGLLYQSGDVEDLSKQIETLYHNRELLNEIGKNAREWSNSNFTLAKHVAGLVSVFEEALADDHNRRLTCRSFPS